MNEKQVSKKAKIKKSNEARCQNMVSMQENLSNKKDERQQTRSRI